jgi:hypothetical protein
VNGTSAKERVQGPNKTFKNAAIREMSMGEGVIVSEVIGKRLVRTLDSADVR